MKFKMLIVLCMLLLQNIFAQYSVKLPYKDIGLKTENGKALFTGGSIYGEPGQPKLSYYTVSFLLPPGTDSKNVKVTIENLQVKTLDKSYDIDPTPPPAVSQGKVVWPAGKTIVNGKDVQVYSTSAYFPSSHLGKVSFGKMRQYNIVDVEIIPYRYNPVSKTLEVITGGTVEVTAPGAKSQSSAIQSNVNQNLSVMEKILKNKVVNFDVKSQYDAQKLTSPSTSSVSTGRFVIITTQAIVNGSTKLNNFIAEKQAKGFIVQVVTENVWGGGTGDVAADRIRNWLKQNYATLDITHVLLLGDPNPTTGTVPMKMCYPRYTDGDYPEAPTDFYYSELSGNWDINGNGRFGEFEDFQMAGGPDKMGEVIVGRIPYYGSMTQLDKILAKSISYDTTSDKKWRRNVLLPTKPSDESTSGMALMQEIKNNILVPQSLNFYRIADSTYSTGTTFTDVTTLNPPAELIPCNYDNVSNVWANNPFGLVIWWTHGWSSGAIDIFTSDLAPMLNDTKPSFTFQVSCTNGEPEDTQNLGYALLANGAIGTVSASRVSWYWPGQTEYVNTPTNSGMSYAFATNMTAEKQSVGEALLNIRWNMTSDASCWWMNLIDFNVYGSPDEALDLPDPTYVSDLPMVSSQNGWGPIEKDMSNGETGTGDGTQIVLGDMAFTKGLGCHAYSEAVYNLDSNYSVFNSWLGVDHETNGNGSVSYHVYADGANIYNSNAFYGTSSPKRISLNVSNVNQLRLVIDSYDNDYNSDHADWADAHLLSGAYNPETYTLNSFVSGSGTISVNPSKAAYNYHDTVTLTAIPSAGYQFTGWSGSLTGTANPATIIMTSNKTVTATFTAIPTYTLNVNVNGSGTVTKNPSKTIYNSGDAVTLTANPASGYRFVSWTGDLVSTTSPVTITMTGNKTINANFTAIPVSIEAEDTRHCSWSNGVVESQYAGYSGTGYVNLVNANGAWIQCNDTVSTAGTYTISVRFANGGTAARTASLIVNGTTVSTGSFPVTGWSTYSMQTFSNVSLRAGANTIRLTATTNDGPANIDRFDISR